jgi:2-keto-4-pentenoate hydratase/2-oxohepta-3-ene-1,7-dioic acid hydratase in catechol pathway
MKLVRFRFDNKVNPGVLLPNNTIADVSSICQDFDEKFFESGGLEKLQKLNISQLPTLDSQLPTLDSCVARPSKIICVGLNYKLHAKETNSPIPKEPILFFKSTTALNGPYDNVVIPRNSEKTDWEVELAIVIGKKATYVEEKDALDYVAGYCLHNDYSERAFQLERGGQWAKGKGCDTFAPMGPFLATKDEIKDVHNLRLWLKVNGEIKQDSNTNDLIFNVPFVVSYISQFMTLLPGDVISTGTPAGVGLGFNPPQFLKAGDVVELGIDGLGEQKQLLVERRES